MKIIERKDVLDVVTKEKCYCVLNNFNNFRLAKAMEFLESEDVIAELVVNGTKENGYWFDSLKVSEDSCFVLAKKHTDGHYYTESEFIRNIEGFEVLPVGAIYELIIEGVTVKFAVSRNFRGEFVESEWICQVTSLKYKTNHVPTEYVLLNHNTVLTWDEYIEKVEENEAEEKRIDDLNKSFGKPWNSTIKHEFGVGNNWE